MFLTKIRKLFHVFRIIYYSRLMKIIKIEINPKRLIVIKEKAWKILGGDSFGNIFWAYIVVFYIHIL